MIITEEENKKWKDIIEDENSPPLKDSYRKQVITRLLENQVQDMQEDGRVLSPLTEGPDNSTAPSYKGDNDYFDPVLVALVRRTMPNLIAFDLAGVQPMNGPTGQVFVIRSLYKTERGEQTGERFDDKGYNDPTPGADDDKRLGEVSKLAEGKEALRDEADTLFSGDGQKEVLDPYGNDPIFSEEFGVGRGMSTLQLEKLGMPGNEFNEMGFKIDKTIVEATGRGLAAGYTIELAQDLKRIHGLDAATELSSILSSEIVAEMNREFVRTILIKSKLGADPAKVGVANQGIFDMSVDADGRHLTEKVRSLMLQIEREANFISLDTRRGRGNWILCSSDVASTIASLGVIDAAPSLNVDDTGNTYLGTTNSGMKIYIDPYATANYLVVGYKGSSPYDAGIFYCPYVPLQQFNATEEKTFQPRIGFKTRYGMISNPFATGFTDYRYGQLGDNRANKYFRIFRVDNINVRDTDY